MKKSLTRSQLAAQRAIDPLAAQLHERRFFLKIMLFTAGAAAPIPAMAQVQQVIVDGVASVGAGCGVITYDLSGSVEFLVDPTRVRLVNLDVDGIVSSGPGVGPMNVKLFRPFLAPLNAGLFNAQPTLAFTDPFNVALRFRAALAGQVQNGVVTDLDFSGVVNGLCDAAAYSTADVVLNMDGVQADPFDPFME